MCTCPTGTKVLQKTTQRRNNTNLASHVVVFQATVLGHEIPTWPCTGRFNLSNTIASGLAPVSTSPFQQAVKFRSFRVPIVVSSKTTMHKCQNTVTPAPLPVQMQKTEALLLPRRQLDSEFSGLCLFHSKKLNARSFHSSAQENSSRPIKQVHT